MRKINSRRAWWFAQATWTTAAAGKAAYDLAGQFSWYHFGAVILFTLFGYAFVRRAGRKQ